MEFQLKIRRQTAKICKCLGSLCVAGSPIKLFPGLSNHKQLRPFVKLWGKRAQVMSESNPWHLSCAEVGWLQSFLIAGWGGEEHVTRRRNPAFQKSSLAVKQRIFSKFQVGVCWHIERWEDGGFCRTQARPKKWVYQRLWTSTLQELGGMVVMLKGSVWIRFKGIQSLFIQIYGLIYLSSAKYWYSWYHPTAVGLTR